MEEWKNQCTIILAKATQKKFEKIENYSFFLRYILFIDISLEHVHMVSYCNGKLKTLFSLSQSETKVEANDMLQQIICEQ